MCLILDASCASTVFLVPRTARFIPLWRWLDSCHGVLVCGGKLTKELFKVRAAADQLAELKRSGRARFIPDEAVEAEIGRLPAPRKSNDPHVLALARLSGARLLCTEDCDLMTDFKDPRPPGHDFLGHLIGAG